MILITGSAGKTGKAIIRALAKSGEKLRAVVRRSDQVARLEALGVGETLVVDMLDPAGMARAVQGVRAVYHIAPNVSPDEVSIGKIVIGAAQSARVERFVFHSVLRPQIQALPHHWLKLLVEEILIESGLSFTILQPTIYMQNILANWDQITKNGFYAVPYSPQTRLSMVDLEDVARVAAKVLTQTGHQGAVYELVGVPVFTPVDMASVLSQRLGRPVNVRVVLLDEWERNARASGMGIYQVETLIKMFRFYDRYGFSGSPNVLSYLLNKKPASFADFVSRTISEQAYDFRAK